VVLTFGASAAQPEPDLIVHDARIVIVDDKFSIAQAMAVKDGRIIGLGTDADILANRGAATTVLDLQGKTVLPGLIDSHVTCPAEEIAQTRVMKTYLGGKPVFSRE
jgi:predicted amidohydrolase YtcJ